MDQLCQIQPLHQLTDALASETLVTLSAIKYVLNHISSDVLVEKMRRQTKEMKRVIREDISKRYTEKTKRVMGMSISLIPGSRAVF